MLSNYKKELTKVEQELIDCQKKSLDFAKTAKIRNYFLPELRNKLTEIEEKASQNLLRKIWVEEEQIVVTIAKKYDLSVKKILLNDQQKLFLMSSILQQRIKGQKRALRIVSDAIFRAQAGIQDPNRPLASFLFVGPTGVGKTEVALTIAEQLFDQKENLVRLDMSEYAEPYSVSKLVGSPPGYIGFEDKPRLEVVREKMYSVILFDEIEKCHSEVVNLLLQILDNGLVTLANGREVNFRNTIIILTTNLGSKLYFEQWNEKELRAGLESEIKKHFQPEFLNRLSEIVFFNSLTEKIVKEIIVKELDSFTRRVEQEKGIRLDYNEEIIEKILQDAYAENSSKLLFSYSIRNDGARPIKHYIEKEIGILVARGVVSQFLQKEGNYLLDLEKETNEIRLSPLPLLTGIKRKIYHLE